MPDSGLYSNVNLTLTISCSEKFSTPSPPPPPCISFSLLPPNPCVCNLVYRESHSKGMVPYRVLTNHPFCILKGVGQGRGWWRGRRRGCCKAESPYPTIWMDTFCVRAVQFSQSSWSKASSMDTTEKKSKKGNLFYLLQSSLSKTDTLRDQPPPSTVYLKWCLLDRVDSISVTLLANAWVILLYFFFE